MRASVIVAAALSFVHVSDADNATRIQMTKLLANGEILIASEVSLTKRDIDTEAEMDIMLNNLGFAWKREQEQFQAQLYTFLDHYRDLSSETRDEVNALVRSNKLLENSMTDLVSCDRTEAISKISIASQFLAHVKNDIDKQAAVEWHPDLRLDPKVSGGCK